MGAILVVCLLVVVALELLKLAGFFFGLGWRVFKLAMVLIALAAIIAALASDDSHHQGRHYQPAPQGPMPGPVR